MTVVLDTTMLLLLMRPNVRAPLDPATGRPVEHAEARIAFLIQELQKAKTRIVVPTPVLSELLVKAGSAGPALLDRFQKASVFRIAPFDTLASIELAEITRAAIDAGDKRGGVEATWTKIRFDRQIVAIAKVHQCQKIYTDDDGLTRFAEAQDLQAIRLADLPLPPSLAQHEFDFSEIDVAPEEEENGE